MQLIPRRLLFLFILLLGLIWIWFSRANPVEVTGGRIPAPRAGFLAPDFTLESITVEPFTLSSLHGIPVIVNFWATWCPPCRAEMPALQAVFDDYQDEIIILAVNTIDQDNLTEVLAFQDSNALSFPVLLDTDGTAQHAYNITSLPTTFFIGWDGVITEVVIGGPMTEAGLRSRIEALLEKLP